MNRLYIELQYKEADKVRSVDDATKKLRREKDDLKAENDQLMQKNNDFKKDFAEKYDLMAADVKGLQEELTSMGGQYGRMKQLNKQLVGEIAAKASKKASQESQHFSFKSGENGHNTQRPVDPYTRAHKLPAEVPPQ